MAIEAVPFGAAPFTVADLEGMPDDGRFYELSHGALVVTPAPALRHQRIATGLVRLLDRHLQEGQDLLMEAELELGEDTVKRPDVMVVDRSAVEGQRYRGTPALVIEVASPSTAMLDRTEKRAAYAAAGISHYWLVDPQTETITVLLLGDGDDYVEHATVGRGEPAEVEVPSRFVLDADAVFD
jgi:Uma2 family endonuclease